jgi:tetratricopeptide (TPR) repeat protein
MEAFMRAGWGAWREKWLVAGCLMLAIAPVFAQKTSASMTPQATREILVDKARALEARGRPDMAIQLWQQILLSDPQNAQALAGLAQDLKLIGSGDQANAVLNRLRQVNPNDPNIARIQAMASTRAQNDQLTHAGQLASQGRVEDAMQIYRQLYGDHPPDGDVGLAYYQTLYGTTNGKVAAIAGLRAMADRNPGDSRYSIELGKMLTYDQRTRAEGLRILRQYPKDSSAEEALRQALVWDAANPASAEELRSYVKEHPQDTQMSHFLQSDEYKLAQMNSGIARTAPERDAFAALNAHHLDEAEQRFTILLAQDPNNGRVAAGMGFLRMQQQNFGGAISYLTQAEQDGYKARPVVTALETSRFWYTMGEATQAFNQNQLNLAAAKYHAALAMRPRSPEALIGLAGLYTRAQQYPAAAQAYEQLVRIEPSHAEVWRGLFLAYAQNNQNEKALAVSARFPGAVRTELSHDPEYLRTLAGIYQAQNRNADAERVLAEALALPFPDNGGTLKEDTKLEYASILMAAKRYPQAAELYVQVLVGDMNNVSAWMGLVGAHHQMGQDTQAIADVQKMPAATYEAALGDPGFLSMLGAIYQQANQLEVAQGLLERSARLQVAAGGQPSIALQLQLAGIYLARNDTDRAYSLYRRILAAHPERADAWNGLISALLATNRNAQALQEIAQVPPAVRKELESDINFVQSEASLYAANGDTARAMQYMNRVEEHYAALKTEPPANIEVQHAWLLFNTQNDRLLYVTLMRLGGRSDLTVTQRETVQDIWANWSVRRASLAMDNGNVQRAVDILDAANQAFPNNLAVRKAVAGGYARVGRAREALALFKTVPMQDASSGDFQGAIGAALAANDRATAETWLRQALDRYPRDPAVLALAARYEQARGDNERAADYYRASLAAMPASSPTDRLAHILVYPDYDTRAHKAVTAADLQRLLNPDYEPFAKTTKLTPLPSYGPDPYDGPTPVVMPPHQQQQQAVPQSEQTSQPVNLPTSSEQQPMQGNSNPAVTTIPAAQSAPQYLNPQSATEQETENAIVPIPAYMVPQNDGAKNDGTIRIIGAPQSASPYLLRTSGAGQSSQNRVPPASQSYGVDVQLSINPPHSLASDAWRGLIFSLMASNKNTEALQELAKVPPDIRRQLESDVAFVQGEASLYIAVGDTARAMADLNRVEDFYVLHRTSAPAALEIQHAWLLYNMNDDVALYPVMQRLDGRTDLIPDQRQQVQEIWAQWAVRRANAAMTAGHLLHGVEILQAASLEFPDNMTIRRAVAGAYSRVGRAADAVTIFKSLPMDNASAGDFQGAVGAALQVPDMAQAEAWLRQALALYPNDPSILELAARFEQARGNNERAADYYRAALAAMPPGSAIESLETGLIYPPGSYHEPTSGDLKRLLDPRNDPLPANGGSSLPALPGYAPSSTNRYQPGVIPPQQRVPQTTPQQQYPYTAPSSNLPVQTPPAAMYTPAPLPGRTTGGSLVYAPQNVPQTGQPVFIRQSWVQEMTPQSAGGDGQDAAQTEQKTRHKKKSSGATTFTGKMHLSPSDEYVGSTEPAAPAQTAQPAPLWRPTQQAQDSAPAAGLRITSEPMNSLAARVQALFADQTDSQLTQGSAATIHAMPSLPVDPLLNSLNGQTAAASQTSGVNAAPGQVTPAGTTPAGSAPSGELSMAQYTPSAQEAATGAYSAPKQQQGQQETPPAPAVQQPEVQPEAKPSAAARVHRSRRARRAAQKQAQSLSTWQGEAPPQTTQAQPQAVEPEPQPQEQAPAVAYPSDQQTQPASSNSGLTDEELQQQNLPPLRGPWVRVQRQPNPTSPREEAEMQLRAIESGYSAWLGGTGVLNYRSGDLGYDHLSALEAPFEASLAMGYNVRLTIVAKPVFLDSGQATGTSVMTVEESTTGGSSLVSIPQPIGTLTTASTTPPEQQNAVGVGGELQLAFPHLAIAAGYTPAGFLVSTFTARAMWRPANGPITINFSRDSVKDSQLSYAGLRDPAGNSLGNEGQIWGGVMANQGELQYSRGDAESGFYFGAGGQYLTGYTVENNTRIDGLGGAYWRLITSPEYGNLSIGANFFAMHYAHNEDAFTHGMGGYFSPQGYFLGNVPFSWQGHYTGKWHYTVMGAMGVQAFSEDAAPLWPLAADAALQTSQNNPMLPAKTEVGPNYDLRTQVAYQISPHWFAGGFLGANNTRNYKEASVGFFVRYMFREQPSTANGPTGLFPTDGLRPFTVP